MTLDTFDEMLALIPKDAPPLRAVLAGSDGENLLKGMFAAQKAGYVEPILVGDRDATRALLQELGLANEKYTMINVPTGMDETQAAVELIRNGEGDILMRGNVLARKFLTHVINKEFGLYDGKIVSHVSIASLPEYPHLIALSDMAVNIAPDLNKRRAIIRNTVEVLNALGTQKPVLALLALLEKVTFHMKDTVDAQSLALENARTPIADCRLWGPISYDLIMSREACRLKKYNCEYSGGGFDGIIAPELTLANTLVKTWLIHGDAHVCGAVVGAKTPIALTSRSASERENFLSLALTCILYRYYKEQKNG